MPAITRPDVVDVIDWHVDSPATSPTEVAADLEVDLGSLLAPTAAMLARAVAATTIAGTAIDLDLVAASAATVSSADFAYDYDYDYDVHLALLHDTGSVHAVLFYNDDEVRLREMVRFVIEGLHAGEYVFLVLTPRLADVVRAALPADLLADAERADRFAISDAHSVLDVLIADGMLDRTAFYEKVAPSVRQMHAEHGSSRICGEGVTLLWEMGNVVAALELEHLWNELQTSVPYTMLCSYPSTLIAEGSEDFTLVSSCHSAVHVH